MAEISTEQLIGHLQTLPRDVQLGQLLEFLSAAEYNVTEQLGHVMSDAWTYLVENELWAARSLTLQDVKDAVNYTNLSQCIKRCQQTQRRRLFQMNGIQKNWGSRPEELLAPGIQPPYVSINLLQMLHRLSKLYTREEAIVHLDAAIAQRLGKPATLKAAYMLPNDVAFAIKQALQQSKARDHSEDQCATQEGSILMAGTTEGAAMESGRALGSPGLGKESPAGAGKENGIAIGTPSRRVGKAPEVGGSGGRLTADAKPANQQEGFHEADNCSCPASLRGSLSRLRNRLSDKEGLPLLEEIIKGPGLATLCRNHLRLLAGNGLGLLNNKPNLDIVRRLQQVSRFRLKMNRLRQRKPGWFLQSRRPALLRDFLSTSRFAQVPDREFDFDPVQVFERFAGEGSWDTWVTDGTIIIPDVFYYLEETGLQELIDKEFDIYRHHHRTTPGTSRLGWLRNMYYSLIQQLARQDPVWYALTAAARPDRGWRLISYPYATKDTDSGGEATGFLQMDLNLVAYLTDGTGGSRLTSSLSIDDEDSEGCTVVVKGLHRHLGHWHTQLLQRGWNSSGATTDCTHIYTAEDQAKWGKPVGVPCPAWGIRLTLPQLIQGSTSRSVRRRRTVLPWYMHIDADHEKLEFPGCLSWGEIRQCHLDLEMPARDPSGYGLRLGAPNERVGGSVVLASTSALGDALVGRRKWTDIQVMQERDILLGPDSEAAQNYVAEVRSRLVDKYRAAFSSMKKAEIIQFGQNSYFVAAENGNGEGGVARFEAETSDSDDSVGSSFSESDSEDIKSEAS